MAKLENIEDVRIVNLVSSLIKEKITKSWLKDIILEKRFRASHFGRDFSIIEFFDICIWDNLADEQQKEVVEAFNLIIEEDLFTEKVSEDNHCFHLLNIAILLNNKFPGKINIKPFIIWKEKDYPNLSQPIDHNHYVIKNLDQKIENAFLDK